MFPLDSDLETQFTFQSEGQPLLTEPPFHILLLGDWSCKENLDSSISKPIVIDRDNFDETMAKLNVRLNITIGGDKKNSLIISFNELDDFHPDSIFRRVSLFSDLRDLRRRLLSETTFNEAAREIRSWFDEKQIPQSETNKETVPQTEVSDVNSENLLDNILSQTIGETHAKTIHSIELNKFLNNIVKPFIVQTDENEQAQLLKVLDDATSDLVRSILHHPKFQKLESAWRGVYLLVRNIETDVDLKIFLLDINKDEMTANLKNNKNLAESDLYKHLVKDTIQTPGGEPWAVVCGNYSFGLNIDDVAALIRISQLSEMANAPFISYILPEIFGISSLAFAPNSSNWNIPEDSNERKLWTTLRSLPEAGFLGFAIPRFLARLPYGRDTDPTETFSFEEFKDVSEHNNYLWANPSFICALLLAQTYRKFGWEMSRNFQQSLSDLPIHIYQEDNETKTKPCAEILMTETTFQKLLDEGLMPLISFKYTDRIHLGRFQSISSIDKILKGRWS